jgi:penicillin-binding protein 1A
LLYGLRQVPDVSGGFIAMDPKTGRVFAIVGGWDYHESQFDRAVQARRQPGSSIKPFVYVTALQGDYTPSSVIEDAPISLPQGPGLPMWTPANYEGNYVGSTTLRQALIHSRNLATARLASQIGMPAIAKTVEQFHVMDKMPLYYSMALGAGDTTLYRLTGAYAMLDNGGRWLNTSMIDMVQDVQGRILYQKATANCAACFIAAGPQLAPDKDPAYTVAGRANPSLIWLKGASYADNPLLYKPTKPDPLVDPVADAEIISMMEGVVQEGTGTAVAAVGKPLAGKTGTTSDWFDAWFVGFSPDLVAGVFVGFDDPRTLGSGETGGHVAAPIFRDFMAAALKDLPAKPFPVAPGAALMASASKGTSGAAAARDDPANLDEDNPDPDDRAAADSDYRDTTMQARTRRGTRDYAEPATPDGALPSWAPPNWPGYTSPRGRGYAAAQVPDDASQGASQGAPRFPGYPAAQPGYAYAPAYTPGYGSGYAPGYAAPPRYSVPAWVRPNGGTGGLY